MLLAVAATNPIPSIERSSKEFFNKSKDIASKLANDALYYSCEGMKKTLLMPRTKLGILHDRSIEMLKETNLIIDKTYPNFYIQNRLDDLGRYIEKQFEPLKEFNEWLDSNGHGGWYQQLAVGMAKLPVRSARSIVVMLYQVVKSITTGVVHPFKAPANLGILLSDLIHSLLQPETWTKMGTGVFGASLGQAAITGNPISDIAVIISAAMIVGGLSAGALTAAVEAKQGQKLQAAKENLIMQAKQIPETLLTGVFMGFLVGGIQKIIRNYRTGKMRLITDEDLNKFAEKVYKHHPYFRRLDGVWASQGEHSAWYDEFGNVYVKSEWKPWQDSSFLSYNDRYQFFSPPKGTGKCFGSYTLKITPKGTEGYFDIKWSKHWLDYKYQDFHFEHTLPLKNVCYPKASIIPGLESTGAIAAAVVKEKPSQMPPSTINESGQKFYQV